jgi:hypothetical protein
VLFFESAGIQDYHRYPLGIERVREQVDATRGDLTLSPRMIAQTGRSLLSQIGYDFAKPGPGRLVALGHEIQSVASLIGGRGRRARVLPVKKLSALAAEIDESGVDRLARRLQLDFRTADLLLYSLELHVGLAQEFRLEEVVVPGEEFEEALLIGLISPAGAVDNFRRQVAQTALNLGRKFKIDTSRSRGCARRSFRSCRNCMTSGDGRR